MSPRPSPRTTAHSLRYSYGTNGLTDLRLDDALSLLADLGYDGVGLTLDHMHLDPLAPDLAARTHKLARRLDELGLGVTIETGARYVLDPRRKHGPSLLDPDPDQRARRADLLVRAVQVATDLGAHAVHCFSGVLPKGTAAKAHADLDAGASGARDAAAGVGPYVAASAGPDAVAGAGPGTEAGAEPDVVAGDAADDEAAAAGDAAEDAAEDVTAAEDTAWKRLAETLTPVLDAAGEAGIPLALEPEPGHLLATLADFHRLRTALGSPEALGLTLDIGHCQCLEPLPPADCVRAAAPWLRHVQIEDMRRGVHEHLPFGDGEIDFPPVLEALAATGYQGLVSVELPRHSHAGPQLAQQSLPFLHHAAASPGSRSTDRPQIPGEGTTASEGRTP